MGRKTNKRKQKLSKDAGKSRYTRRKSPVAGEAK